MNSSLTYCLICYSVITALGVGFTMLCEEDYSKLLSFCFLDEIQREFIVTYSTQRVQAAKRPYAFIEFGENKFCYHSPAHVCEGCYTTCLSVCDPQGIYSGCVNPYMPKQHTNEVNLSDKVQKSCISE